MGEVKKDIKITVIAFVINYLFFYIPVSLYLISVSYTHLTLPTTSRV